MASTYLLLIDQIYVQPVQTLETEDDLLDVITRVDFHYEATSPTGTKMSWQSSKDMSNPAPENYIAYKDVTYEDCQDWVKLNEEDELEIKKILDSQIEEIEFQKYIKPDKMPWEELPPGQEEIDAQNAQNEE